MKEVPADKKKSLGKLPTEVRNKMGYMRKGGKVSKDKMTNSQEAYAEGLRTGKGLPILRNIDKGISKAVSTPKEKRMIEKGYKDMRKAKKAEKARKKGSKLKMKKGGSVKGKCKVDGIAVRGRTRVKHK